MGEEMLRRTTITISLHPDDENPVFGENATHITYADEAAGAFIKLTQFPDDTVDGQQTVRLGGDEMIEVAKIAAELLAQEV